MKTARAWQSHLRDLLTMAGSRQRPHLKRPVWIMVLVSMVCLFLIAAYVYPLGSSTTCNFFTSRGCGIYTAEELVPSRELTDDEIYSRVVVREILKTPPLESKNPKIAFLFLTPGSLPFERLWHKFFQVKLSFLYINLLLVGLYIYLAHGIPCFSLFVVNQCCYLCLWFACWS